MKGPTLHNSFLSLLLLLSLNATAQWSASAELDTNRMRIGEQTVLTLSLEHQENEGVDVRFPQVEELLGDSIEVLEKSSIDTLVPHEKEAPELRRLTQEVRITSFDSGYYPIPPLPFEVNGDSISSEPLLLEVQSVPLEESKEPRAIKDVHRFPYSWSAWFHDHWPWLAAGAGLLIAALLLFLYYRKKKKKGSEAPAPPPRPPHEIALEQLWKLDEEKAWRSMEVKSFYTELSQVLRQYLEDRYDIPALEETTGRILHELSYSTIDEEGKGRLRKILKTADMAKFAKQRPDAATREDSLRHAIDLVERSIPRTEKEEGTESEEAKAS